MIEKMYWISVIRYLKETSWTKLSWQHLKPDHYFTKIAEYFNGFRDKVQIKSLDERLKKKFFHGRNLDIVDAISEALRELPLNEEEERIFMEF